ncbi:MAG: sulfate transporter CysZ [Nitrospira sp.]|nr:sulfate transporter CysZ [Nitrospira sp.]
MLTDFFAGFRYGLKGIKLISRPELRPYVYIPLIINAILFTAAIYTGYIQYEVFLNWLLPQNSWWTDITAIFLWILFYTLIMVVIFFTFLLLANLIASPFNSLLAEKTEAILEGRTHSDSDNIGFLSTIIPSIINESKKLGYFVLRSLAVLLLLLLPFASLFFPAVWFLFTSWMLALEFTSYPMENNRIYFSEGRNQLRSRKSLVMGFGAAVTILAIIPVINFIAMPAAISGATALWVDRIK